jgi:sulfite exporter TauE/SafE
MEILYTAIALGFATGFHCLGMCGPIAFAVPVDRENKIKGSFQNIVYQLGRVMTYTIFGALFGLVGKGLSLSISQQYLSLIMGVSMILVILWPSEKFGSLKLTSGLYRFVGGIKSKLGLLLKKKDSKTLFFIGLLNGTLPCGPVYAAIFLAIATGSAFEGSLFMFLFGIGTIPFMFAATSIGNFLSLNVRNKLSKAIPYFVVVIGALFIIRGLGLGIPLLSPPDKVLEPMPKSEMKKIMMGGKKGHMKNQMKNMDNNYKIDSTADSTAKSE